MIFFKQGYYKENKNENQPGNCEINYLAHLATSRKDKFLKHRLYEHEGVKYYCIVDPDSNHAIMFHIGDNQYRQLEDFKDGKITMEIGKCLIEFDFAKVFKEL